ncbi:MAG: hypothetical protein AB7O50_11495 [Pseudolabrys sp.]
MTTSASTILRKRRFGWRAGLLCAAACLSLLAALPAYAQTQAADEEEKSIDEKIIDSILKGAGLRDDSPNIEYRERSPLVIPPGSTLPAPGQSAAANNPNWPVDPEVRRARAAKKNASNTFLTGDPEVDETRPLRPSEMHPGRRVERGVVSSSGRDPADPLRPSDLGTKRGVFSSIFSSDEEAAPFTGEPPRASLTDPPRGYQTPSPAQPYGVGKSKAGYSAGQADDSYTTRHEKRE